jgi:hypothetical protein
VAITLDTYWHVLPAADEQVARTLASVRDPRQRVTAGVSTACPRALVLQDVSAGQDAFSASST